MSTWLTWKEKGRRMVLKPISFMRQATVSKFWVMALGPCHRPSTAVEPVSNPNLPTMQGLQELRLQDLKVPGVSCR